MLLPGRTYQAGSTSYRYGFNGKELDKEVVQYDYGFRIYDPRLVRFKSVDPLTRSYPMLTPYQFASNRPIDGVDLDGLEYLTVHLYFAKDKDGNTYLQKTEKQDFRNMTAEQIKLAHGMDTKEFYGRFSTSFGKEGRGVKWVYHNTDGTTETGWEMRQTGSLKSLFGGASDIEYHGLYSGGGSITTQGPNVKHVGPNTIGNAEANSYDFGYTPIDHADAISKSHDMTQDKIVDYQGWLEDTRTLESDNTLYNENAAYQKLIQAPNSTYIDPITKRKASAEANNRSEGIELLFGMAIQYKQWKAQRLTELGYDPTDARSQQHVTLDDWKSGGLQQVILQQSGGGKTKAQMADYWKPQ